MRRLLVFVVLLGCGRTQGLDDGYLSDDLVDADSLSDASTADAASTDTGSVISFDAIADSSRADSNATLDASACLARPVVCAPGTYAYRTLREIGNACEEEVGAGHCAQMMVSFDAEGCATALTHVWVSKEVFAVCVARKLSEVRFGCIRSDDSELFMGCGVK